MSKTWSQPEEVVAAARIQHDAISEYTRTFSGVEQVALQLDVFDNPTLETTVRVVCIKSLDGVRWSEPASVTAFTGIGEAGRRIETVNVDVPYVRFAFKPLEYGINASLSAVSC